MKCGGVYEVGGVVVFVKGVVWLKVVRGTGNRGKRENLEKYFVVHDFNFL